MEFEPHRKIMEDAIRKAWPEDADAIIASVRWDSLLGCWFFERFGMTIGVEKDGCIHS